MILEQKRQQSFQSLVGEATFEELVWMAGFLQGTLSANRKPAIESSPATQAASIKLTIAYGTETGNAKSVATKLAAQAKAAGATAKLVALDQYRTADLTKEKLLVLVVSTHGDGEPPAAVKKFYDFLFSTNVSLQGLHYGVVALGDSAYPLFCQTGKDLDARLSALGASRIQPIQLCDTDYETPALAWGESLLKSLGEGAVSREVVAVSPAPVNSGKRYCTGTVLRNVNLNDEGSSKQTHHIEIAAEGLQYEPGDALGIIPQNNDEAVRTVLSLTGLSGDELLTVRDRTAPVRELLQSSLNISCLRPRTVRRIAALLGQDIPDVTLSLADLLAIYPTADSAQALKLLAELEPTAPRLYSIASSPSAHEGEVHLTVRRDEFFVNDAARYGLCSDALSLLEEGAEISFYIQPNKAFRLPAPDCDVILIGPGTGVAPFRAFVAERAATGATGRSWLFFGDQHFLTDFLYQTEWQAHLESGDLTRISLAFSRDQPEKIYVQHRMKEEATELWAWLQAGAHFYVCGTREPMSRDVEETLLRIAEEQGGLTEAEAQSWLESLKAEGRYQKDVY